MAPVLLIALLGIGRMNSFAAAQALIGQDAPVKERGAVRGAFGPWGAVGIVLATRVGGWRFDNWTQAGPFVMVGLANLMIVALSLIARSMSPGPDARTSLVQRHPERRTGDNVGIN